MEKQRKGMRRVSRERVILRLNKVDIIYLQETLALSDQITPSLKSLVPGWHFYALDVHGRSSGMEFGYNP